MVPENAEWKADEGDTEIDFINDVEFEEDWITPEWDIGYTDEGFWGDFWSTIGQAGRGLGNILNSDKTRNLLNLGSGIYGMFEADKLRGMSERAFANADPFGSYRKQYGDQLLALMANPDSVKELPGYEFQFEQGAEAVSRKMGSKGYLGSGNMATALTEYGQNFASNYFDKQANMLARLAGADISPNQSGALAGYGSGIDVASAALASLGYEAESQRPDTRTPRPVKGPNSAGGEAAQLATGLRVGGSIANLAGQEELGSNLSGAASKVGNLYGIYSGLEQGGWEGYSQAAGSAASLAGVSKPPVVSVVEAGQSLAEGDPGGAGVGLATAAVPLAGLGFIAADLFNKSGDVKSGYTTGLIDELVKQGVITPATGYGRVPTYRTKSGRIIRADQGARRASEALRHGNQEEFTKYLSEWLGE
jgi:hypothetical protein